MGFGEAISSGFRNYANFSGRARRSEFWYWMLFTALVTLAAAVLDDLVGPAAGYTPFHFIAGICVFIPAIAVSVRRLHDVDRTGWWLLLTFTGIGDVLLLIWDCTKGSTGANRFGEDPIPNQTETQTSER